jgi:glycosyltransferase involved in cell wall biosynthesis
MSDRSTVRSKPLHATVLTYFDARDSTPEFRSGASPWRLPYSADALTEHDIALEFPDAHRRSPWRRPRVRSVVRALEGLSAPFLQTLLAAPMLRRSDVVLGLFESQANAICLLRALRIRPYARPRLVVVSCWLAMDLERFGRARRALYRWSYRRVDHLVFFSQNQAAIYRDMLGLGAERLAFVPFGVDHRFFAPIDEPDGDYVLAVGRDRGRDWATLFDAVEGMSLAVKVACRREDIAGLRVPENVEVLGVVDRERYRQLTGRARVVVVATLPRAYPSGQSVLLESMAMARCCVVTDTPAIRDYVVDGVNAIAVPPADSNALRAAIGSAAVDDALRSQIGRSARQAVEERFNAEAMWEHIGHLLWAR